MVAFWPLVGEAFALFCRLDSSVEVNELKTNSAGNSNEVEVLVIPMFSFTVYT